jgi:hypothetical protein
LRWLPAPSAPIMRNISSIHLLSRSPPQAPRHQGHIRPLCFVTHTCGTSLIGTRMPAHFPAPSTRYKLSAKLPSAHFAHLRISRSALQPLCSRSIARRIAAANLYNQIPFLRLMQEIGRQDHHAEQAAERHLPAQSRVNATVVPFSAARNRNRQAECASRSHRASNSRSSVATTTTSRLSSSRFRSRLRLFIGASCGSRKTARLRHWANPWILAVSDEHRCVSYRPSLWPLSSDTER